MNALLSLLYFQIAIISLFENITKRVVHSLKTKVLFVIVGGYKYDVGIY